MLTVVGGTYLEICTDPHWYELYGSGLRGAAALSGHIENIKYVSCIGKDKAQDVEAICGSFNITPVLTLIEHTTSFNYYTPLTKPIASFKQDSSEKLNLDDVESENILMYGLIEANVKVKGNYVVYDPQNWLSFKSTGSKAQHLAIVLNKKEAYLLSGLNEQTELAEVGKYLLVNENAEVVAIKDGSNGAIVIERAGIHIIPVYETNTVWPIGSGDIFSAVFAWKWAVEKLSAKEAAILASKLTAQYCESTILPLPGQAKNFRQITPNHSRKNIYLAGPFYSIAERWLISEARDKLTEFGNNVFSPFHDVGLGTAEQVVDKDLEAIEKADVIFAVLSGLDAGTIFEIGYAKALKKKIIILAENIKENDLIMFTGTGCEIVSDFSTAIYKASW